jgi:1-deoxy-D-xylulose-5-phosphate synthase
MNIMMAAMPKRTFDVGIAEGHAVTFSGGMAKDGLLPFCNIYSAFMQRAVDNVIHDVAIPNLHVVMCLDRAGLVGEDGPTHHGVFDIALFHSVPNLTLASPMDECELRRLMYTAQLPDKGPFIIRYPRGHGSVTNWHCPFEEVPVGKGRKLKEGKDMAIISYGPLGVRAARAIDKAESELNISIAHYDLRFAKPIDTAMLDEIGNDFQKIITIEDGVKEGGIGSIITDYMSDHDYHPEIIRIGVPDQYVEHGTVDQLYHLCGMDEDGICLAINTLLK